MNVKLGATLSIVVIASAALMVAPAGAGVLIHITESGSDVIVTTSGSVDTTDWGVPGGSTINPAGQVWINDSSGNHFSFGVGAQDYWFEPGSAGLFVFEDHGFSDDTYSNWSATLTSGGGDVGFRSTGLVWLPGGYSSGDPIDQVLTLTGVSFLSMGIEDGDWARISWGGTVPDHITMSVGSAVPVELQSFSID